MLIAALRTTATMAALPRVVMVAEAIQLNMEDAINGCAGSTNHSHRDLTAVGATSMLPLASATEALRPS